MDRLIEFVNVLAWIWLGISPIVLSVIFGLGVEKGITSSLEAHRANCFNKYCRRCHPGAGPGKEHEHC